MSALLFELVRFLPADGQWRFAGQRERWLHAVSLAVDLEMDNRKQAAQKRWFAERVEVAQVVDIGPCGVVALNGHSGE